MIHLFEKLIMVTKKAGRLVLVLVFVLLLIILFTNYTIKSESSGFIFKDTSAIKEAQAALVLGASVKPNKEMSDVFRDRVDTAIKLYNEKKVSKIIISGDHGKKYYDEVSAAKKYILEKNIPPEDVFLDHAGFDTYDSVYRAKYIFKAQSIVIVTQDFHLPRAIFIARRLGHNVQGLSADLHSYSGINFMRNREIFANVKAYFDILLNEKSEFLGPQIDLNGSGVVTWD